jgi:hypothetical protein
VSISAISSPHPSTASSVKNVEMIKLLTDLKKARDEYIPKL